MNRAKNHENEGSGVFPGLDLGHKLAEYNALIRELYTSSERYRAIVESSDDAILSKDLNGIITSWNSGAQRIFGHTESEAIGRSIKMLIPPELHGEEDGILARVRKGLRIDHYVTRRIRKDGTPVEISLTISPIKNEYGEVVGASKVARDIGVQLRESTLRNRLSAIVESSDDAIISKDLNGTITSWNQGAERIFGYTSEEIIGSPILRLIPKELQHEEAMILSRLRKGERIDHFQTTRLHKNGTRIDLSITVSPVRNDRGEIIGASKVARDIRTQLNESELRARLSAIVESSDDAIISKDLNGIITSWNKGAERIFGHTAEEFIGKPVLLLIPEELQSEEAEIMRKLRSGERIDHYNTIRVHKSGARMDMSLTISPIRNDHGEMIGASKVARDISRDKKAFNDLRESEEKFTTIFMGSPVGAVLLEEDTFHILDANPAFVQLMDVPLEALLGGPVWDDHRLMDVETWKVIQQELITTGKILEKELQLISETGHIDLLLNATFLNIRGERRILMHVEDITERKAAVVALREADRKKDEFIATLAHELRNPLAPLSNALQIMEMMPDDMAVMQNARAMMDRQLKHMVRLMDDLMDVSRVSRGVIELRMEEIDLRAVLAQAVEATKPMIDEHQHTLVQEHHGGPIMIKGDPARLVQIFSNLLNNAAKYTEKGGTIHLKSTSQKNISLVSIRDTGIGIEPDKLDRAFDMFAQLEPATTRKRSGLGIGLSIVKQLVQMHKGTIVATSEGKGKGSTFTIELPLLQDRKRSEKNEVRARRK